MDRMGICPLTFQMDNTKLNGFLHPVLSGTLSKILTTLGKTDFKPLRKFNGANFYICFAILSEEPKIIEKIDLAKCPF